MEPITPQLSLVVFPAGTLAVVYAKDQPEYLPLPAYQQPDGTVTSCWLPNAEERERLIAGEPIYIDLLTFGQPLQPLRVYVAPEAA
jgi:hypothetical protein